MVGDYKKYADDAVKSRADNEGLGRLRMSTFIAMLGPLAIGACKALSLTPSANIKYGIIATGPVAILLLIINYLRLPGPVMVSVKAFGIALSTFVLAIATWFIARKLGFMP